MVRVNVMIFIFTKILGINITTRIDTATLAHNFKQWLHVSESESIEMHNYKINIMTSSNWNIFRVTGHL